jgi:hypothetical protein
MGPGVRRDDEADTAFSRHSLSEFCKDLVPRNKRAQGKPDARCTRGLVCKTVQEHAHEHTGPVVAIRLSLSKGFNAYGFVRPVGLAKPRRDLTATTEASGPHDLV